MYLPVDVELWNVLAALWEERGFRPQGKEILCATEVALWHIPLCLNNVTHLLSVWSPANYGIVKTCKVHTKFTKLQK